MAQKADFDSWSLEFPWSLELGIWSLRIGHRPVSFFTWLSPPFRLLRCYNPHGYWGLSRFRGATFFPMLHPKTCIIPNKDGPCCGVAAENSPRWQIPLKGVRKTPDARCPDRRAGLPKASRPQRIPNPRYSRLPAGVTTELIRGPTAFQGLSNVNSLPRGFPPVLAVTP